MPPDFKLDHYLRFLLMLPALVTPEIFRRRLESLETWLWERGPRELGVPGKPPRPQALAKQVLELSDLYTTGRGGLGTADDPAHLAAKVFYFLISDAPKVSLVLRELVERYGSWPAGEPRALRVVDLGAGVGATAAGLLLSLDAAGIAGVAGGVPGVSAVHMDAFDADARALRVWRGVAHRAAAIAGVRLHAHQHTADVRALADDQTPRSWDLCVAQSLMNELFPPHPDEQRGGAVHEERAAWLRRWASRGLTVVIEPALRVTTRPLHAARDRVLAQGGVRVLAPCPHGGACPMLPAERDWCHEVRRVEPTPRVAEVQALTRRRDERTKFSFVVMGPGEPEGEESSGAGVGAKPRAAGEGVTFEGRLVSDALASKGKTERVVCTAGGQLVQLRVLDKERTPANEALITAQRGRFVRVRNPDGSARIGKEARVEVSGTDLE